MTRLHQIVAIVAGLLAIVGGLNTYIGLPIPWLLLLNKHTVTHISTTPQFLIESIKSTNNTVINSGDSFSYKFGIPITARGTTSLLENESVWVLVADQTGHYYLQYPPVAIRSSDWVATNIRPLEDIKRIIFARTDVEGNLFFLRKVEHNEWGKLNDLPPGTSEVAFVQLE